MEPELTLVVVVACWYPHTNYILRFLCQLCWSWCEKMICSSVCCVRRPQFRAVCVCVCLCCCCCCPRACHHQAIHVGFSPSFIEHFISSSSVVTWQHTPTWKVFSIALIWLQDGRHLSQAAKLKTLTCARSCSTFVQLNVSNTAWFSNPLAIVIWCC